MDIKIRKAKTSDWQIIQKLNAEVFEASTPFDPHLDNEWPHSPDGVGYFRQALADPGNCCLIASDNDKPIGYLIGKERNYAYRTNRSAEIDNMGVSPAFRSRGIGTLLVNRFKTWAKKRRITHLRVNTYFHSSRARTFYEKQGLQNIDLTLEGKI